MREATPRERFIEVAARLFAERGYAATSVADIQTALGLTAGSGALYKHFSSKRALRALINQVDGAGYLTPEVRAVEMVRVLEDLEAAHDGDRDRVAVQTTGIG